MELKVKNANKGQRGFWAGGELVFVDGGQTGTFTGASKSEAEAAAAIAGMEVWADGKAMTEQKPQAEKPWLVIARSADGTDMKTIDLGDRWMIGMAIASERPEGPSGYTFVKIGGDMEVLPETAVVPAEHEPEAVGSEVAEPVTVVTQDGHVESVDPEAFDAAGLVAGNAAEVVKALDGASPDRVALIKAAEEAREGGPRKGVMKAVEDAHADPFGD